MMNPHKLYRATPFQSTMINLFILIKEVDRGEEWRFCSRDSIYSRSTQGTANALCMELATLRLLLRASEKSTAERGCLQPTTAEMVVKPDILAARVIGNKKRGS